MTYLGMFAYKNRTNNLNIDVLLKCNLFIISRKVLPVDHQEVTGNVLVINRATRGNRTSRLHLVTLD